MFEARKVGIDVGKIQEIGGAGVEYFIFGIIIIVVVAGSFIFWKQMKRQNQLSENKLEQYNMAGIHESSMLANEMDQLMIHLEQLPLDAISNDSKLMEIKDSAQLLGQANLTLKGFTKNNDLNYTEYEGQIEKIQNWFVYQKTLMEIMIKIAELKHTLHLGTVSREQCGAFLPTYSKQVNDVLKSLGSWHNSKVEKFGLNVDELNRKRVGFDSIIHAIPARINAEKKYRSVSDKTVNKIVAQSNGYVAPDNLTPIDLFQEDVKIIAKEGKIYYLPDNAEKSI